MSTVETSSADEGHAAAACRGVLLIVGNAYCGSTLLNVLLGSHPQIAGGGELHWLAREEAAQKALGPRGEADGRCAFCGADCPLWTSEVRAEVRLDNIYEVTSRVLGRPIVCDASKMPDWSLLMAPVPGPPRVRILMVKHPLRHVASFLEKARRFDHMSNLSTIDQVLDHLTKVYDWAREEPVDVVLRYEDLVADPRAALTPILARFGLDWDPAVDDWRIAVHHHIGGNAGPRAQIAPTIRPTGGFLQRKYNRSDVFVDDSFADILTPGEIEEILAHPKAAALIEAFGYDAKIASDGSVRGGAMDEAVGLESLRAAPEGLVGPFEPDGGHAFRARLELLPQHRYFASVADTKFSHRRSPLLLLEDGQPLGPGHRSHTEIRAEGGGRYSHWEEVLYFSASDNSNPNTNGRAYAAGTDASLAEMTHAAAQASVEAGPVILSGPFEPIDRHSFIAQLEPLAQHLYFESVADNEAHPRRSPLRVFEDGRPLGPAHVFHDIIAAKGRGRYSHWNEVLYFSASDNSDPNTNGRIYAVRPDETVAEMTLLAAKASLQTRPLILTGSFEPVGDHGFRLPLDVLPQHLYFASVADNETFPRRSPLRLWEDGEPLGPPHVFHDVIAAKGQGRYSHWKEVLCFSASDNSDPNTNGRTYTLGPDESLGTMTLAAAKSSLEAGPVSLLRPFDVDGGHSFIARIQNLAQHLFFESVADTEQFHSRSPLVLLEDGKPLGPAHAHDVAIRSRGGGLFRHLNEVLYFSTSDNSDPNTNGRTYALALPDDL